MHPLLFELGSFPIRSYGLLVAGALVAGIFLTMRQARFFGLDQQYVLDCVAASIVGGIVGARVVFVLVNIQNFADDPMAALRIQEGGSVFFGGVIGGLAAAVVVAKWRGLPILRTLDTSVVGATGGMVMGRLGCVAEGCCYGRATDVPWAILLHEEMRHPVQIYQSFEAVILFVAAIWFSKRFRTPGVPFAAYLGAAGILRIFQENLFRGDALRGTFGALSTSTWIGAALVITAIAFVVMQRHTLRNP